MKLWLSTKEKKTEDRGRKKWREIYQQRKTAAYAMDVKNGGKRRKKADNRKESWYHYWLKNSTMTCSLSCHLLYYLSANISHTREQWQLWLLSAGSSTVFYNRGCKGRNWHLYWLSITDLISRMTSLSTCSSLSEFNGPSRSDCPTVASLCTRQIYSL